MLKQLRALFSKAPTPPADPKALFATEVETFLRSTPSITTVTRVPGDFAFEVVASSGSHRVFLDNVFAETREMSPEQRQEKIAFFFSSVVGPDQNESWDVAREILVPVLRGATYGIELWVKRPEAAFVRRPFLPYVDLAVAVDRPTSMSFVSRVTVEGWKVEEREVFEAAAARAAVLASASVELYDETYGPLWIVTSNDSYESSRLAVPGWLASFRGKVEGNPIAIIPERATLMIAGDARAEMIERLLDKADREFMASNRRLSPALYSVNDEGRVVPCVLPDDHPLAAKVKIAHERLALYEYEQQKKALEELYAATGFDVYLSSYSVFKDTRGEPRSLCFWPKGVRSYLPRTQSVMAGIPGANGAKSAPPFEIPFEAIEGRLTAVPDLHPPRFETTGEFPNDDELRAMAEAMATPRKA